ncbi:hypothetical protein K457DRAFT_138939 [Linnemannia elongata AG-77]|uniref:RING-type E3 ubiquitin transferase n=1 Tax=Linnemannia elongata AG-77 TaxID=1314771 RepID=A0A197JTG1_9FUNG|nr:hypothetical protein K457DRAFT_138939 [Linnemannia elongata AG-77]
MAHPAMDNIHTTTTTAGAGSESVLRNRHHPSTSSSSPLSTQPSSQEEDEVLLKAQAAVEERPHGSSTAVLSSSAHKDKSSSLSQGWASLQGDADITESESLVPGAIATMPDQGQEDTVAVARESVRATSTISTGSTVAATTTIASTTALPSTTPTESETATLTPTLTTTTKPIDVAGLAVQATTGLGSGSDSESNGEFSCNICFDTSMSPVLTLCGHLFCWACLHQWLEAQHQNPTCPVCKAGCAQDKVIPIYGRGKEQLDPRSTTPKRPAGQRPEPFRNPNQAGFALGTGQVTFSGTMLPPFMFTPFGIQYGATYSGTIGGNGAVQTPMQAYVSRMFFMLGTLILVGILLY